MNDETINIDEQLDILEETKAQIKQAIINKGQYISDYDSFRSYVDKINAISSSLTTLNVPIWYMNIAASINLSLDYILANETKVGFVVSNQPSDCTRIDDFDNVIRTQLSDGDFVIANSIALEKGELDELINVPYLVYGTVTDISLDEGVYTGNIKFIDAVCLEDFTNATNITANNIKSGETILGVHGTYDGIDTSDATATANDLADNITAYVNGNKITGNVFTVPAGVTNSSGSVALRNGEGWLYITDTFNVNTLYRPNSSNGINLVWSDLAQTIGLTEGKIKSGETIIGVTGNYTGIDTSDATAVAGDIAYNKTAYVNGSKITGTLEDVASQSPRSVDGDGAREETMSYQSTIVPALELSGDMDSDTIIRKNARVKIIVPDQIITPVIGLTAEKIKSGETILGVTGNFQGIPDGIFIQETQPTKTTAEAIWLKEETIGTTTWIDSLPATVLDITDNYGRTYRQFFNALTTEQKNRINSARMHIIEVNSPRNLVVYICDKAVYTKEGSAYCIYKYNPLMYTIEWGAYDNVPQEYNYTDRSRMILGNFNMTAEELSTTYLFDQDIYDTNENLFCSKNYTVDSTEEGIHIDINNKRYTVFDNKASSWTKMLDTSDATATASDIVKNKTAYVNNQKVTGQVVEQPSGHTGSPIDMNSTTYHDWNNGYRTLELNVNQDILQRVGSGISVPITNPYMQKDLVSEMGVTSSKIKKGENILGVTGTYEGTAMKEYNSENAMNADIANIADGEVVKVIEVDKTTYYIKEAGTPSVWAPVNLSKYQVGDTISLKGMKLAKTFTAVGASEYSSGEGADFTVGDGAVSGTLRIAIMVTGQGLKAMVVINGSANYYTLSNTETFTLSDNDLEALNSNAIWSSTSTFTISSGVDLEVLNGSILEETGGTSDQMVKLVKENETLSPTDYEEAEEQIDDLFGENENDEEPNEGPLA